MAFLLLADAGQLQAFYAKDNIFQRRSIYPLLCVLYAWIYNDQIIGGYGIALILDQKLSCSSGYIKKFEQLWVWGVLCQSPPYLAELT